MPLSIGKLTKLLTVRGLLPKRFFIMHKLYVYIEVLSIASADSFMLYIPSKYEINSRNGDNIYDMSYLDISEDGNIAGDYAVNPDNFELEKAYDGNEIDLSSSDQGKYKDLEGHLEESYNHPVSLKNIGKLDINEIREIFRQLRRLRFCVQSLKYKLCITYKNYICTIRRDNTFEGFIVKNFQNGDKRKLIITIDLESLYDKLDSIGIDVKTVREGVYKVLERNQVKQMRNLQKMLEQKSDLSTSSDRLMVKKLHYSESLVRLEKMLTDLSKAEEYNIEKLMQINERYNNDPSLKGLHGDIERSHQVAKYETELTRINIVKQELIRTLLLVKSMYENLCLKVDRVCFDNSIMLDAISKNFVTLTDLY